MNARIAYVLPLLLLGLPLAIFAAQGNARKITLAEAVWVGIPGTQLAAGDYEVKWDGSTRVQVRFLQGRKTIVTVSAMLEASAHDRDSVKIVVLSESSKALENISWKDVSLTFDIAHPF